MVVSSHGYSVDVYPISTGGWNFTVGLLTDGS